MWPLFWQSLENKIVIQNWKCDYIPDVELNFKKNSVTIYLKGIIQLKNNVLLKSPEYPLEY